MTLSQLEQRPIDGFKTKLAMTTSDYACRQSVEWNLVRKDSFLSSSWDDTVKVGALRCTASSAVAHPGLGFRGDAFCFMGNVVVPNFKAP